MDDADFNDPAFIFWSLVFLVFWLFVMLAIVYGFLRLVHAVWVERRRRPEAERRRPSHAPVEPPAPVRRDDFYGHGPPRSSRSSTGGADDDPHERNG